MTYIRAICIMCEQDVMLKPWEVTIMLSDDLDDAEYVFEHCGAPTVRRADRQVVALLLACGCQAETKQRLHPSVRNTIRDIRQKYILDAFEDWIDSVDTVADMEASLDH